MALGALAREYQSLKKAAMTENAIAQEIVDAAFRIHTALGPGLLESVYNAVLAVNSLSVASKLSANRQSRLSTGRFGSIGFRADRISRTG